jgi:hypothetical protein
VDYFKVISWHLPGDTDNTRKAPVIVAGSPPEIQVQNVTATQICLVHNLLNPWCRILF